MPVQHMIHTAVQHNDFELRLKSIKFSLPLFFFYNMQNYARFGSFYKLSRFKRSIGLSIQAQDKYPHRTPIDMRE